MRPAEAAEREAVAELAANARRNGVEVLLRDDGALEVPGEAVTDPVAYTLALAAAAQRHGAELHAPFRVAGVDHEDGGLVLHARGGELVRCRVAVNCAGLEADEVARLAGDDSFEVYPRKGEFLVFDPPGGEPLERILLPVPTKRTKGVLVFPTIDGKVVAGPTAVDQRGQGRLVGAAAGARMRSCRRRWRCYPPLEDAEPVAAYAGLRPAGRGVNYLIGPSRACSRLVNVAAIRSTGPDRVARRSPSVSARSSASSAWRSARSGRSSPAPRARVAGPWWRRTAELPGAR